MAPFGAIFIFLKSDLKTNAQSLERAILDSIRNLVFVSSRRIARNKLTEEAC